MLMLTTGLQKHVDERLDPLLPVDEQERVVALREILVLIQNKIDATLSGVPKNSRADDEDAPAGLVTETSALSEKEVERLLTELKAASGAFPNIPFGVLKKNANAMSSLSRLEGMGARMAVTSLTDSEIVLGDSVDDLDVEAQEKTLLQLSGQEREAAIVKLEAQVPAIRTYLQRSDSSRGINYYEFMVLCTALRIEPMPEDAYRDLQKKKNLDLRTISWLLTDKRRLDRGDALGGDRCGVGVRVGERGADRRVGIRGGRARLRVQVS